MVRLRSLTATWMGFSSLGLVLFHNSSWHKHILIPPTVDRYSTDSRSQHIGQGVSRVPTDIPTHNVDRRSINSNNVSTEYLPICRPTYRLSIGQYIGRLSVYLNKVAPCDKPSSVTLYSIVRLQCPV